MSTLSDGDAIKNKTGDESSSRQLPQTIQFKFDLQETSSSPANASKLLEIISLQSKQGSAQLDKNVLTVPYTSHVPEEKNPIEPQIIPKSLSSKPTAAPVTVSIQSSAGDARISKGTVLQASNEKKIPQVQQLARTGVDHSKMKFGEVQEGGGAIASAPNPNHVLGQDIHVPSIANLVKYTGSSQSIHSIGSTTSTSTGLDRAQPILNLGQKIIVNLGSQNFYNLLTAKKGKSVLHLQPVSKPPSEKLLVSKSVTVSAGNSNVGTAMVNTKSLSLQTDDKKQKITVTPYTNRCNPDLSKTPSLSQPSRMTLEHQEFKQGYYSHTFSNTQKSKELNKSVLANTIGQPLRSTVVGNKNNLETYLNGRPVMSTTSSASISLPSGHLSTVASGHLQAIAGQKSKVVILSKQEACTANTSHVSTSSRNVGGINSTPSLLRCSPSITRVDTRVSGVSAGASQLHPTHSNNSLMLLRNSTNPPGKKLPVIKVIKDGNQATSLLNTPSSSCVTPTNSLTLKTSAKPAVRPIQPKPDNVILPLHVARKLTSHTSNEQVSQGPTYSTSHLKKLIISKESLFNLNKISQRVTMVPKDMSDAAIGVTDKSKFIPSSASNSIIDLTKDSSTQATLATPAGARPLSQASSSKSTRLSTASISRRSYLQMLRDDSPRERGSFSLISNKNVNLKRDLKRTYASQGSNPVSIAGPVFLTTTLRTASGPIAVKVRAPSIGTDSDVPPVVEKFVTHTPVMPQLGKVVSDPVCNNKQSIQKSEENLKKHKIPDLIRCESQNNSSFVMPPAEQDDDSSDSDLEYIHHSEEQDMRVLSQLLQQDRQQTSETQATEKFADSLNLSQAHSDITPCNNSDQFSSEPLIGKETDCCVGENNAKLDNPCSMSSSMTQGKSDAKTQDLRIASVFSLNPTSEIKDEQVGEDVQKEKIVYDDEVIYFDDTLVKSSDSAVTPCYCVLERLSEQDIEKLSFPDLEHPHEIGSRCSEYCRKRTLTMMCNLNLLPSKCQLTVPMNEQTYENQVRDSHGIEEKMPVLKVKSILKKKPSDFPNEQNVSEVDQQRAPEFLGSNIIKQGSPSKISLQDEYSSEQKETLQISRPDSEPAAVETDLLGPFSTEFGSAFKPVSGVSPEQLLKKSPQLKPPGNQHGSPNSPQKTSFQSSVFKKAISILRKQVERKRIQMHKYKHVGKSKKQLAPNAINCTKSPCGKVQFGKKKDLKPKDNNFSSDKIEKPSILTSDAEGKVKKHLVLPHTNQPIVARLLPPNSVRTQDIAASECRKNDISASKNISSVHSAAKINPTPIMRSLLRKPSLAAAQNVQWSAKISEALKSLHLYLQSTGKQFSKTEENQHFLLRLGDQHILVTIPPSRAATGESPNIASDAVIPISTANSQCPHSSNVKLVANAQNHDLNSQSTQKAVNSAIAPKNIPNKEAVQKSNSIPDIAEKSTINPQSFFMKNSSQGIHTAKVSDTSVAINSREQCDMTTSSIRHCQAEQSQSGVISASSRNPLEKRPLIYADPLSSLSHLPLDSSLLPTPKLNAQNRLSREEQASKRKLLEKKYPLPPGVVIKVEPDVSFDYEEVACSRPVLESATEIEYNSNSSPRLNPDKCDYSEEHLDSMSAGETFPLGDNTDSIICDTDNSGDPPPLINEASLKTRRRRKRSRTKRSTARASDSPLNDDKQPPVLLPMCDPPLNSFVQTTLSASRDKSGITSSTEESVPSELFIEGADNPPKRRRLNPEEDATMSSSTSSITSDSLNSQLSTDPHKQGFKATDVAVSKNIRIQRLKELLKKKEEEIEAMKRIRSELPPLHLEDT